MLTYVINTSENRTMDSDRLFDLAGYNKIRWLNCPLCDVAQCAQHIYEKQNVLGADQFRIAVLVDFFNFDRVRVPYGRRGYKPEVGVDISLYLPYIEIFLLDNLISYLENRELYAEEFEIYYVQNTKLERYNFLSNATDQLRQILTGDAESAVPEENEEANENGADTADAESGKTDPPAGDTPPKTAEPAEEEAVLPEDTVLYSAFRLYCTPNVSLTFRMSDYPYGMEAATFPGFIKAFEERINQKYDIRRHYYVSGYGGGQARAAFDTLTLSLYLIRMYEREESADTDGEFEIRRMDAEGLKDVLVTAWNKITLARDAARSGSTLYYSLKHNVHVDTDALAPKYQSGTDIFDSTYTETEASMTPEQMYESVRYYHGRTPEQLAADKRAELDRLMNDYLKNRDEIKAVDVRAEMEESMRDGSLITTHQFPSEEEYIHTVKEKEEEISRRFGNVLSAAYIEVDFSEEKERAHKAFDSYKKAKACLYRKLWGDLIFMVLALLAVLTPYVSLQLTKFNMQFLPALILGLETLGLFFGLFVLAVVIQFGMYFARVARAKKDLKDAYRDAYKKECDSLVQLRQRYTEDLIFIERTRYELRQLRYLYELNRTKEENVKRHRFLLEELEDRLASMLNNLDVEPVMDPDEDLTGEFDITKPIRSRENKIYRIFSLETIEKLFLRKGRDET